MSKNVGCVKTTNDIPLSIKTSKIIPENSPYLTISEDLRLKIKIFESYDKAKIYLTDEDRKTARQKYLHDWKQKDESKIKIREYQRKYNKNIKIQNIIKTTGKQEDNNIIELKK